MTPSLHQNCSFPSHQYLHAAESDRQCSALVLSIPGHGCSLPLLRTLCSLGFQGTTLLQFSSDPVAIPSHFSSCAPLNLHHLLLLEVPGPSICVTSLLHVPHSPGDLIQSQQISVLHWWFPSFYLQLEPVSELQTHEAKCLLILPIWMSNRHTNTDILIRSHPKICSSIKSFPSQWVGNSALPVVQTKNLWGILDSLSFTLWLYLQNIPRIHRLLTTCSKTLIRQTTNTFYLGYFSCPLTT